MELFSVVDDAQAIIRVGVVFKQVKVFHRRGQLYIPHGGGYIRVIPAAFDESFPTAHPSTKVIEIEGPGIIVANKELRYKP